MKCGRLHRSAAACRGDKGAREARRETQPASSQPWRLLTTVRLACGGDAWRCVAMQTGIRRDTRGRHRERRHAPQHRSWSSSCNQQLQAAEKQHVPHRTPCTSSVRFVTPPPPAPVCAGGLCPRLESGLFVESCNRAVTEPACFGKTHDDVKVHSCACVHGKRVHSEDPSFLGELLRVAALSRSP